MTETLSFGRPGVYVRETPLPLSLPPTSGSVAVGLMLGACPEGPIEPVWCGSWKAFTRLFNVLDTDNHFFRGVYQAFSNGAPGLYAVRVAAARSMAARMSSDDMVFCPFEIHANSPGAWGNALSVRVFEEEKTLPDDETTWRVVVSRADNRQTFADEVFRRLSLSEDSPRYFAAVINDSETGSQWVRAVPNSEHEPVGALDVTWAQVGDDGQIRIDVLRKDTAALEITLRGGEDGVVKPTDYLDTLETATGLDNCILVHCPDASYLKGGEPSIINAGLVTWAAERKDSFAITDTPAGLSPTEAVMHNTVVSSYGACYYPHIRISNPSRVATAGSSIMVAPGAAVFGSILAIDRMIGPWEAPAGTQMGLEGALPSLAVGVERRLTSSELDYLNTQSTPVNAIRALTGKGIVVMGARTLHTKDISRYVSVRRTLNYIKKELERICEVALFQPITSELMQNMEILVSTHLSGIWERGGLAGRVQQEAFYVICDRTINTPQDAAEGRLNIDVGLALLVPAEYVIVRVGQFQGQTSINEIEEEARF